MIYRHLLIDWLTLRHPLNDHLTSTVRHRIEEARGKIQCYDSQGALIWQKNTLDVDKLRSDTPGIVWQIQSDGKTHYLAIAGSPSSLRNKGLNVFGDLDIRSNALVLLRAASRALRSILPPLECWSCRRIDITGNYLLPDSDCVKHALRQLLVSDGARRRASSTRGGGDTVAWNPTSDLSKGKAYHKGPQVQRLVKLGKVNASPDQLALLHRLLRFEHTKGAKFWRRFEERGGLWYQITAWELWVEYRNFFARLVPGIEVNEMERTATIKKLMEVNCISEGRAKAAFTTLRNIRDDGYQVIKESMVQRTWYLHLRYLRAIGITDADMTTAKVLPVRPVRIILASPVGSWSELFKSA